MDRQVTFVQDKHSRSVNNALRDLHYQIQQPQGKLVCLVQGEIFYVAIDIQKSSPVFMGYMAPWASLAKTVKKTSGASAIWPKSSWKRV
jgi:dTDP-4-dehydrorhamnose 3,5-epimerase-like enzyme